MSARMPALQSGPLGLGWPTDLPRYWNRNEIYRTHYMNALSLLFPNGEQFFIDSVRAFRSENTDPALEEAIRGFISQEGWHRHEHAAYNAYLARQGYPSRKLEDRIGDKLDFGKRNSQPMDWLAATVCLEHFTAIMAEALLSNPDWLQDMHPHFRRLWIWHAVEELEHKAVAFDLYCMVGGSFRRRAWAMLTVSVLFPFDVQWNVFNLLRADGKQWSPRIWWHGIRFLFGRDPGLFWKILPAWRRFFRRDFHPWDDDSTALVQRGKAWLKELEN